MKNTDLRQDILDELEFEPSLDAADIGVAVEDGTVTLTGHVPTYAQRRTAEKLVKRVKGVRAIAEGIEVRPYGSHVTADDEIAKRAAKALHWNAAVPRDGIQVRVEDGVITLMGKVRWHYEKTAAREAVQGLEGVRNIANQITIEPAASVPDVKKRIEDALKRDAELEAKNIQIKISEHKVTLDGKVRNWAERRAVERAAWSAPGVSAVTDNIRIGS